LRYKLLFISARGNLRSWLPAIGPSHAPAATQASAPCSVDLDAAADQAIVAGRGDARKATSYFLGLRFEELTAAVSKDDSRGRLPQIRKLKDAL